MTLDQIKSAVNEGKIVHWSHEGYVVRKDNIGQFNIICLQNDTCIGLTWKDGETMNGKPEEFFIATTPAS